MEHGIARLPAHTYDLGMAPENDSKTSTPAVKAARKRVEPQEGTTGRSRPDKEAPGGVAIDLSVPVSEITPEGERVAERLPQGWLNHLIGGVEGAETGWWASRDGSVELRLSGENPAMLRLRGQGEFALKHACVRCLQELELKMDLAFDLRLIEGVGEIFPGDKYDLDPQHLASDDDEDEGNPLDDDDDLVTYQGDTIDLAPIIREQVLLEVPMHPRCDDDGVTAEGPCNFDPAGAIEAERERWVDPRWAALGEMKDKLKQ